MNAYPTVDLHMHSTVSDGTDSPAQLLDRVREAGLGFFALTDHDAVKGCRSIRALLRPGDPVFLDGAEFSCRDEGGKYHILGYAFDPEAEPILRLTETTHALRMKKVRARLDFLGEQFGFTFPPAEVDELLAMDNPGKPHIADMMVRRGYAEDVGQAIREYLNRLRFRSEYLSPEQVIPAVLDAGGIPVLAHPFYGDGEQLIVGEEMDARLRHLLDFGLRGLESFYSGFTPRMTRQALELAERYDLYCTAGSDYHGTHKLVALGDTGLTGDWPEGLRRFAEDARSRRA